MARKPMVTRTIVSTKVTALLVNVDTEATETREILVPGNHKEITSKVQNLAKELLPIGFQLVLVKKVEPSTKLYRMKEVDFIKYADELDETTRKPIVKEETPTDVVPGEALPSEA